MLSLLCDPEEEVGNQVFISFGVITVTFGVLSWLVNTKCYSHSWIVLQLTVVPPGEYPVNRII
jgi:hypothetical protein